MSGQPGATPAIEFTADEIRKLPKSVRDKIKAISGVEAGASGGWMLVGATTKKQAAIIKKTVRTVSAIAADRRAALTEKNISQLVDLYLEGEPRAEIDEELDRDNAALRADYLKSTPCYTGAQIRANLRKAPPKNKSEPASRWKREGRIFAVQDRGVDLFPQFQFQDGEPLKVISKILAALPEDMSAWQVAFWFASGNGWLDRDAPQDKLKDESAVVVAAVELNEIAAG